jgi:thioredoxin-related protein
MKRYLIGILILTFVSSVGSQHLLFSQTTSKEKTKEQSASVKKDSTITWYKYDEGLAKAKKDKKHVMVHFYTNWCGWCKRMDKLTFDNVEIKKMLNGNFVAVKVNAESADKVKVDGKEMTLRQLAATYNARAYPDTWFLKPTGERIGERKGYVEADEFQYILKWVKGDLYDKVTFPEFVKQQQEKQDSEKK